MDTVTTQPEYGSVERFADMIRRQARDHFDVNSCLIGIIDAIADPDTGLGLAITDDTGRIVRVRNALAAADLVRAEMVAAR